MICGNCISYLTDEDDNGNVTEFHHDKNRNTGFCAVRDLFYTVKKDNKACNDFISDGDEKENILNTPINADSFGLKNPTPPAMKVIEALETLRYIAKVSLDTDDNKKTFLDELIKLLPESYKVVEK